MRTAGRSGILLAAYFWLIALAIGVIVLSRASTAEFSTWAPICQECVVPQVRAAWESHLVTIDSRSFPKHDWREMGWEDLGSEYVFLPDLGMITQFAVFHSGGWVPQVR